MVRSYLIRNTTRYDINLGDLRYRIPAGQVRNLLSPTARIRLEDLEKSKTSGSIAVRLEKGTLVEVKKFIDLSPPGKKEVSTANFPRRRESSLHANVDELDEKLNDMTLSEEDEFLKELQNEDPMAEVPLVSRDGREDDGTET